MANLPNKMREKLSQMFLDSLSQELLPWKACWQTSLPENAVNGKRYKGINSLMLAFAAAQSGYSDHRWCTFNQAAEKGWHIIKGAHGWPVEYWAYYDRDKKKLLSWADARKLFKTNPDYANENLVLRSRVYTVFNGCQMEGIPEIQQSNSRNPDSIRMQRDTLFRNMGLALQEGGSQPYYAPETDTVHLPFEKDFFDSYSYACTMLHECGHATGHPSRLNRDLTGSFGTSDYAKEELRAEIASAFAAQALGLRLTDKQLESHIGLHTAYIQSWAKSISDAPEELFKAIKDAEIISDYLIEKGEFLLEQDHTLEEPSRNADNIPAAGRIDFLASNGTVAESVEYHTEADLINAVRHESYIGSPFSLVLYEDSNGHTIPKSFLQDLGCPPKSISQERHAGMPVTPQQASISPSERIAAAKQLAQNQPRAMSSGKRIDISR